MNNYIGYADILCTATSVDIGQGPVIDDVDTKPWLHINAVGSDFPGKVELPQTLLNRSIICPDFLEQAVNEGECQQLERHAIGPTLYELVQHHGDYRDLREQLTVFDSTGWAIEDQVAMDMLMDYATELGLGQKIQLESVTTDPRNPYQTVQTVHVEAMRPAIQETQPIQFSAEGAFSHAESSRAALEYAAPYIATPRISETFWIDRV